MIISNALFEKYPSKDAALSECAGSLHQDRNVWATDSSYCAQDSINTQPVVCNDNAEYVPLRVAYEESVSQLRSPFKL